MSSAPAPDQAMLQRSFTLLQQVHAAMTPAYEARTADAANALDKQATLCAAIRIFVAAVVAGEAAADSLSMDMVVNEFGVLGNLLAAAGRVAEAEAAFDETAMAASRLGTPAHEARVAIDRAIFLQRRGAYAQALALLFATRDHLAARGEDPDAQVSATVNLGTALSELFRWLGDHGRAATEVGHTKRLAVGLARRAADRSDAAASLLFEQDLGQLLFQAAMILLEAGRWRWARSVLEASAPYLASLGPAPAASLDFYRARLALGEHRHTEALVLIDGLCAAFDQLPSLRAKRGALRVLRASTLIAAGRAAEALPDAREGVRLEGAADQRESIWKAHWQEARATRAAAGNAAALHAFDQVIAALDGVRRASLGLRLDSLFLKERLPAVEEAILCAAAHGDAARGLAYADAVKSRFLASALTAGAPPLPSPELLEKLDRLAMQIDTTADAEKRQELVRERAAQVERIRLERGPLPAPPGDPALLLELLTARGQAALQLFHASGRVVAVLLQDGRLAIDMLELSPETRAGLRAYAANLMLAVPSSPDFDPQHLGLDAAGLVPPRLLEQALGAKALLVAPHAALNILPWAALPRGGRRLFEHLPIGQLPCIAALSPLAALPASLPRLALLGDPQSPRATREEGRADLGSSVADLAALYGPGRMVALPITRRAASTAGFNDLLAAPGAERCILHLACHGRFDHDDPHGSGLLLADRMLTAAEVALRPLPAREVTLAACSTGVRPEAAGGVRLLGDDVVGLPASFLEAGAAAVLVSVTRAGDREATAFFHAYHAARLVNSTPLEAFAAAQRTMLADDRWKIRRWVGFTLYGCA